MVLGTEDLQEGTFAKRTNNDTNLVDAKRALATILTCLSNSLGSIIDLCFVHYHRSENKILQQNIVKSKFKGPSLTVQYIRGSK